MNKSHIPFHHVASAPCGIADTMMTDDDTTSRDSGVSMTMDENTPMCFSSLTAEMQSHMAVESMDFDEEVPKKASKGKTFGRQNSCNKGLFNESCTTPKVSRDSTGALTVRSSNQQQLRKRSMEAGDEEEFQQKRERSSDHYHLEPTGESAEDVIDAIEQQLEEYDEMAMEPMFEDYPAGQESTSSDYVAFPLPAGQAKGKGSLVHHHTVPNMKSNEHEEEKEEMDENHLCVEYHLPGTGSMCSTSFRRIGAKTMINVLNSLTAEEFNKKFILIDCRYPFEYKAGHIKHAINFYNPEAVSSIFYKSAHEKLHHRIPIFYCEFSQKRGPSMANALRKLDRHYNFRCYPRCSFEEMYVLDKGYREFHRYTTMIKVTNLCEPRHDYVEMNDQRYAAELRRYQYHKRSLPMGTIRRFYEKAVSVSLSGPNVTIAKVLPDGAPEEEREPENPAQRQRRLQGGDLSNKTPQMTRHMSRRALTFDQPLQDSPTNFNRPARPADAPESPPPANPVSNLNF